MVGKLMKHELKALFRSLLYLGVVAVALALIARILMASDPDGVGSMIFIFISIYMALILIIAAFCVSIANFSRSLFTGEGYMTFSLPATATELILSKLLSAIIASLFGVAVFFACLFLVLSGLPTEAWQSLMQELGMVFERIGMIFGSDPLLAVEFVIQIIVSIPMTLLFFYLVESIGQLFTAHRKGITVAIGIGFIIVFLPLFETYCLTPLFNALAEVNVHLSAWFQILLYAGVDVGCFFAVRYILTHKLNLLV